MDQSTQRTLIYGATAVVVGYAAYQIYMSMSASGSASTSNSQSYSGSRAAPAPKKPAYTPKGDPESWSEDDMKKYLTSRNLGMGLDHASKHELLAMVESKMHEPTSTGFDDPEEWSAEEMKEFLRSNNLAVGHNPSRLELLAMVEAKMHEPK
ncbi:hypothetical protein B0A55_01080 [Friedmanniomyces simplex]|uniref:Uncharacterized protein n=1 Tax=Friedmanniomyces simplex TaxID=329884 RepID=A0A4U0XXN1_9PEZI|nr:hypothetical protein B0A55_01080 [Friedmanniomyces simplex]